MNWQVLILWIWVRFVLYINSFLLPFLAFCACYQKGHFINCILIVLVGIFFQTWTNLCSLLCIHYRIILNAFIIPQMYLLVISLSSKTATWLLTLLKTKTSSLSIPFLQGIFLKLKFLFLLGLPTSVWDISWTGDVFRFPHTHEVKLNDDLFLAQITTPKDSTIRMEYTEPPPPHNI